MGSILGSGNPLEQEMETYSSILAWKIPWTKEPGGLQSTGHQEPDTTEHTHTQDGKQKLEVMESSWAFSTRLVVNLMGKLKEAPWSTKWNYTWHHRPPPLGTTALKLERLSIGQNQALNVDQS